jgi:hypothetical protein
MKYVVLFAQVCTRHRFVCRLEECHIHGPPPAMSRSAPRSDHKQELREWLVQQARLLEDSVDEILQQLVAAKLHRIDRVIARLSEVTDPLSFLVSIGIQDLDARDILSAIQQSAGSSSSVSAAGAASTPSSPTNSWGSSNAATTTSSEPSREVVQPQVPVRVAETNVGAEEKKQDVTHHATPASPSPTTTHVPRPMATAIGERQVLMELFHATCGSSWAKKDSWGTDRLLVNWHGVKVDEEGRITHLLLSSNQLTGTRMSRSTPS